MKKKSDNQLKLKINLNALFDDNKCHHTDARCRFRCCCSNHSNDRHLNSGNNYFLNLKPSERLNKNDKILMKSKNRNNSSLKLKIFASQLIETNLNSHFNDQSSNMERNLSRMKTNQKNCKQIEQNSPQNNCKFHFSFLK